MNPLILLVLAFVLKERIPRRSVGSFVREALEEPLYFDTFRMEMILDRLRMLTEMMEKVNRLSQVSQLSDVMEMLGGLEGVTSLLQMKENDGI